MITSRGFTECLLAALIAGGLVAILASPIAGLVAGVVLAVAATTLIPCGWLVDWDAKRAMRKYDPEHARRPPISIVRYQRPSPVPHPGWTCHLVVVHPHDGHTASGTTGTALVSQLRFTPRSWRPVQGTSCSAADCSGRHR